jgi:hypothetical protein
LIGLSDWLHEMTKLKLGNAIVCEFIAQGINNKHSIINNYAGNIFVAEFPANVSLAFYIELFADFTATLKGSITVSLDKKKIASLDAEFEFKEGIPNIVVAPTASILIEKQSTLNLVVSIAGHKPIKAINKPIILNANLKTTA